LAAIEAIFRTGRESGLDFHGIVGGMTDSIATKKVARSKLVLQCPSEKTVAMIQDVDDFEKRLSAALISAFEQLPLSSFGYDPNREYSDNDGEEGGVEESENEVEALLVVLDEE
jgi:hypothetical protein